MKIYQSAFGKLLLAFVLPVTLSADGPNSSPPLYVTMFDLHTSTACPLQPPIYMIQADYNLSAQDRNFGVPLEIIEATNPGVNPKRLLIGQKFTVPDRNQHADSARLNHIVSVDNPPPLTTAPQALAKNPVADFVAQFASATGIKLVKIPAGTFLMGSPADEVGHDRDEGPQTRVVLTSDFFLGATAITNSQYYAVMGLKFKFYKSDPTIYPEKDMPIVSVSWEEATEFCRLLTEQEKVAGRLPAGYEFSLPTEAQREYACRAGTTGAYAGILDTISWYNNDSNSKTIMHPTHPVGTKQPNAWGLYDMEGNVWEWCADWYGSYLGGTVTDPMGPFMGEVVGVRGMRGRVVRGGSVDWDALSCRSAHRGWATMDDHNLDIGFRIALSVAVNANNFARYYPYIEAEIRQRPDDASDYFLHGVDRNAMGDYEGAISDYLQAIKLAKDDAANVRFFLLLTQRRLHRQEDTAGLAEAMAGWHDGWTKTVGRYLTGVISETDFLAAVGQGEKDQMVRQHHCEALYFIGMTHLIAGDTGAAKNFFDQCLKIQGTSFLEHELAQSELGILSVAK